MPGRRGTVRTMIGHLSGTVTDGGDVLTAAGIGYAVSTTSPLTPGAAVSLHVHTAHTQTDVRLYGFATVAERQVFTRLIAITGVGPAAGLAVLAELGPAGLAAAVRTGDTKAVQAAKGIGARSAQRILTEVNLDGIDLPDGDTPPHQTLPAAHADCLDMLAGMGLDDDDVQAITAQAAAATPDADGPTLLRNVLRRLNGGVAA